MGFRSATGGSNLRGSGSPSLATLLVATTLLVFGPRSLEAEGKRRCDPCLQRLGGEVDPAVFLEAFAKDKDTVALGAFADWLEENGRPKHAALIHYLLSGGSKDSPDYYVLRWKAYDEFARSGDFERLRPWGTVDFSAETGLLRFTPNQPGSLDLVPEAVVWMIAELQFPPSGTGDLSGISRRYPHVVTIDLGKVRGGSAVRRNADAFPNLRKLVEPPEEDDRESPGYGVGYR
jgi:uncharacterized protein (TIGR02996 family)